MTIRLTTTRRPRGSADRRRRFVVRTSYESYFPTAARSDYDALLNASGVQLKSEPRTRIVLLRRHATAAAEKAMRSFVLKIYRYPLLPRIRTGFRISKAEQEFNSLRFISQQGVPAADPVGFGVERTFLGFVRSCFIITSFVEGSIDFSQWKSNGANQTGPPTSQNHDLLKQIGQMFRRLHEARFFLFTAKTKNLVIRQDAAALPETFFIDVPYARRLSWRPLARWGQRRDLGLFLANFNPALTQDETASFYEGYLPDPLGGSAAALRRHVLRAMRSKQNLTPLSALVHHLKRNLRHKLAPRRSPERCR